VLGDQVLGNQVLGTQAAANIAPTIKALYIYDLDTLISSIGRWVIHSIS
jgi:hypothetical protein